jgi:hypothetical protein
MDNTVWLVIGLAACLCITLHSSLPLRPFCREMRSRNFGGIHPQTLM